MSRTDGSHSFSGACRKAGGLFRTIRRRLRRSNSGNLPELRPQSREKLLMDIVKPTVAENRDHIFWPEHWNDSVHNRVGILLVECGPARLCDRSNDLLRF